MIQLLAIAAGLGIVVCYLGTVRGADPVVLHAANALGFPIIALSEIVTRAWGALVVTLAFGFVGIVGYWRHVQVDDTSGVRYRTVVGRSTPSAPSLRRPPKHGGAQ